MGRGKILMKIRDILVLTKEKRLSEIAKEHLDIGEKPARLALKNAGCFYESGKKGWHFKGDEKILDMEIYEFSNPKASGKSKKNNGVNIENKKDEKIVEKVVELKEVTEERKRASFDLNVDLLKRLKIIAVYEDKKIYEIVEKALLDYINKNEFEPISRAEEDELPVFNSHDEARAWFKNKYGDNFMMTGSFGEGEDKIYLYDLLLNRERYMYFLKTRDFNNHDRLNYFQSLSISAKGDVHIVH